MKQHMSVFWPLLKVAVLALAVSAGCSKEIPIVQYPVFWEPGRIRTVAVVPFRNTSLDPQAGNTIADRLAIALAANGTYQHVYNRLDMQALMTERDLEMLAGGQGDPAALLSRLTDIQVIIVGTVTSFEATSHDQPRSEPVYYWDAHGNQQYGGQRSFVRTTNDAIVSASAQMLAQRTGGSIHAMISPAQSHVQDIGEPPNMSMDVCLATAVDEVVYQLLEQFAIIRKVIKVNPKETFFTSTGERFDGEWIRQDKFTTADETMAVIVNMPAEADRNTFRIAIIRRDTTTDLDEATFTWSRDNPAFGMAFEFSPRDFAAAGGGPGDYVAKLYVGERPVLEHRFRIEQPR